MRITYFFDLNLYETPNTGYLRKVKNKYIAIIFPFAMNKELWFLKVNLSYDIIDPEKVPKTTTQQQNGAIILLYWSNVLCEWRNKVSV